MANVFEKTKKVAVVTGANKGIGRSIVKLLINKGYEGDVILTARDVDRGQRTAQELSGICRKAPIFHQLDVTSVPSVEKLRDFLQHFYGGLDVLINNAGTTFNHKSPVPYADQARTIISTNYFGILNTSHILYPLLRSSSRVVHLSSMLGHLSKIPGQQVRARLSSKDLTEEQLTEMMNEFLQAAKDKTNETNGWGPSAYNVSKAAVTALGFLQQRLFDRDPRPDMVVNSVHPGYVKTDLTNHKGPLTPDEGADAAVYLATLPPNDPTNPKGQFVWHDRRVVQWDAETMPRD